ncbi:MAG: gliding motility-associated C-terminal domain-containing protein, partial [Bacteroidia bacterium]|nr:gliding motility-associated C-terminal domain-containing protein [Bacteroidia bacterium]
SNVVGIGGTFQAPFATLTQSGNNPAVGTVCWTPSCTYQGDTIRVVVGGRDTADCPGYNIVFDTTYIIVNPINRPTLTHTLPGGGTGDTLKVDPNKNFCVNFTATDADILDTLVILPLSGPFPPLGGTASFTVTGTNPVNGQICWTPSCALAGQTFTFILQAQDTNRCLNKALDTLVIEVNQLQPVGASGNATICIGASAPLSAFGGVSYSWSPATGLSNPNIASPTATPTVSTQYTVAITDAFGCVRTESVQVNVNPLPVVNAGPNVTKCPGTTVPLQATGGVLYSWSPATGLSNPNISNPIANPAATTNYTVTVTDANGCVNTDQVLVTVMQGLAGPGGYVCSGDSLSLGASGGIMYAWSPVLGLSNPNISNPKASPTTTTLYTVTITDAAGCVDTDTVTVGVYPTTPANAGADAPLCFGDSLTLNASGGVSYLWTASPSLLGTTLSNPVVFPQTSSWYGVTVTDANGCFGTDSVFITVLSLPIPEAGNDTAKCGEIGVPLAASGGINYQWFPTTGLNNAAISDPVANPAASMMYFVTVTDGNGCSDTDSVFVRVMYADAGPDLPLCIGDSLLLQAAGGIAYQWQASPFLLNANTSTPVVFPSATSDFIVTVTDTSGCTDTDTMTVTVNPLPTTSTFGTDPYVCSGGGTVVNATGGSQYLWTPGAIFNDPTLASPIASPTYSGTTLDSTWRFFVTVTDTNGCVNHDSLDQVVRLLPIIFFSNDTVNCPGGSVPLFGSGGINTSWSPAYALNTTVGNNVIASPDTTTTYTVLIEAVWGCSDSAEIEVIVMVPEAGLNDTICLRDTIVLAGSGGAIYEWSPAAGLSDPTLPNPSAFPQITTTYLLTVTDSLGCVDTDTVRIDVNPLPPAFAGVDQEICIGDTAQLLATGGLIYQWLTADSLSSPFTAATAAWPLNTTSYPISVTDGNGCTELDTMELVVHPLPMADAGPDQTQCGEDSVSLVASGGILYQWSPAMGLGSPNLGITSADPDSTIRYFVTVTDQFGCVNVDSVLIRTMYAVAGPAIITCPEDSVQLSASSIGGLAASYSWNPVLGLSNPGAAQPGALPGFTTTYQVTITDTSGCSDTASQLVTVFPVPNADAGPDREICIFDTIQLAASGGVIYEWDPEASLSSLMIADPLANPLASTTYRVMVTDVNGCNLADTVRITVNPLPVVDAGLDTIICNRDQAFLLATGANTYLWSPAGSLSNPRAAAPVASPEDDLWYYVEGTDLNGCKNNDSIFVEVRPLPMLSGDDYYEICLGQTTYLAVEGADGYLWNTGDDFPVLEVDPEFTTEYWVIPLGPTGCQGDRLDIQVYVERNLPQAALEPSVTEGFYPLEVNFSNLSANATNFLWKFGDGDTSSAARPMHIYNRPGEYVITLTADNDIGCPDSTQFSLIEALDFVAFFPNAFTPNDDGENDEFRLVIRAFEQVTFQVFDRWGRKVFESNQQDVRWDGTKGGIPLGEGVYVYTFRGVTYLGEVIERNGSITLIR